MAVVMVSRNHKMHVLRIEKIR